MKSAYRILVMGVSGCGKSTVGARLASKVHGRFVDGDSLHPASNIEKMSKGEPLDDADRAPWLKEIAKRFHQAKQNSETLIIACSALKKRYREELRQADGRLITLFLEVDKNTLMTRMLAREEEGKHFMPASLLDSQLASLENPTDETLVLRLSHALSIDEQVNQTLHFLSELA
uniref:gluconokinase n=1 Tax=Ningiella ruwaisensis TaxID=2364274 RepID=UPI00109F0779|nr:gluconokinase [Ningiella ruwaisensis]